MIPWHGMFERKRWKDSVASLRQTSFRRFFLSQCLSFVGDAMLMTTLPLTLLDHGFKGSAFGYILTATSLARVLGLFAGGVLADRFRRDVLLILGDSLRAIVQLIVVVLLVSGQHSTTILVILYSLFGLGSAIFLPASQGLISQVTSDQTRLSANSLLAFAENVAMMVVPALAAILVLTLGSVVGIAVDGVSFILSAALLSTLRTTWVRRDKTSALSDLKAGLFTVMHTGWLRNGILTFTAINCLGFAPFLVLIPIVLKYSHHESAWGLILAVQAVGAVLGGALAGRLHIRRPLFAAFGSCAAWVLTLFAVVSGYPLPVVIVLASGTGFCSSLLSVIWNTAIQSELPLEQIGRVSSLDAIGSLCVQPIAYSLLGFIAAVGATAHALTLCALGLGLLLLLSCTSRGIRLFTFNLDVGAS